MHPEFALEDQFLSAAALILNNMQPAPEMFCVVPLRPV
jgi:hypothetical protein